MVFRPKIQLILLLLIAFTIISCQKKDVYPVIPVITYDSFTILPTSDVNTTNGILKISFTDGDGDIGLDQTDTAGPYKSDLFIYFLELQNGIYKQLLVFNN